MRVINNNTPTPSEGTVPTEIREEMPFGKWFQNFYNNINLHPSLFEIELIIYPDIINGGDNDDGN